MTADLEPLEEVDLGRIRYHAAAKRYELVRSAFKPTVTALTLLGPSGQAVCASVRRSSLRIGDDALKPQTAA